MGIGYGRVSTREQNLDAQRDALAAAGCERVFVDQASGVLASRPDLDKALLVAPGRGPAGGDQVSGTGQQPGWTGWAARWST